MNKSRDAIIKRIKALLSKTVANGATEAEAMEAFAKAQSMMDAHEVSNDEVAQTKQERAEILEVYTSGGHSGFKFQVALAVAEFCDCKAWGKGDNLEFAGLKIDTEFAHWLVESLGVFGLAELNRYMGARGIDLDKPVRGREATMQDDIVFGFAHGLASRISQRLREIKKASTPTGNGKALVAIKTHLIDRCMADAGIHLGRSRSVARSGEAAAYEAGWSTGDKASFGRPVSGSAGVLRIGRS